MKATVHRTDARPLPQDFEEIFRDHHELVYRTAYRITGNPHDAEDVLQTLFLRLLRSEHPPDLDRNPKGYLHRGAINVALDVIKARNRNASGGEADIPAEPTRDDSDIQECMRQALTELNPRAAEIFILRHVEGYTNAEIAGLLGTSRGVVAVLLFRARAGLRKSIRTQLGEKS